MPTKSTDIYVLRKSASLREVLYNMSLQNAERHLRKKVILKER